MSSEVSILTAQQNDWLDKVSGMVRAEDDHLRTNYTKTRAALTARLKQAIPLDHDKTMADALQAAETHFQKEEYDAALHCLDSAGQTATELIKKSGTYENNQGKTVPSKAGEVGASKPLKSKELSPEVLQSDRADHVYYANTPQARAQSEFKVDAEGRLVDAHGNPLHGKHGYVVSAEDGSQHHFDEQKGDREGKRLHHSSEVAGGAVTAAGEQNVKAGVLRKVTDKSGHYTPDGEMTHSYVEGLVNQGAKTRDESFFALGADGKVRFTTPTEETNYKRVQEELPALEQEEKNLRSAGGPPTAEVDQKLKDIAAKIAELKSIQAELRKNGVGPANKDATVELYNPHTRFSPEEWRQVQGDEAKILAAIEAKLGTTVGLDGAKFPLTTTVANLNKDDINETNKYIGVLLRMAEDPRYAHVADKSKSNIGLDAERFLQTGGNTRAILGKQEVNAELLASNKTSISAEITELGGPEKLRAMGFDPSKCNPLEQLKLLQNAVSADGVKKLEELGITDPSAFPGATLVELLHTADTLKELGVNPVGWTPDAMLVVIRLARSINDLVRVKARLATVYPRAKDLSRASAYDIAGVLRESKAIEAKEEAEQKWQEEMALLGGLDALKAIGFTDVYHFSKDQLLDILKRKQSFAGLGGTAAIDSITMGDLRVFVTTRTVDQMLEFLLAAKELKDRGIEASDYSYGDIFKLLAKVRNGESVEDMKRAPISYTTLG